MAGGEGELEEQNALEISASGYRPLVGQSENNSLTSHRDCSAQRFWLQNRENRTINRSGMRVAFSLLGLIEILLVLVVVLLAKLHATDEQRF